MYMIQKSNKMLKLKKQKNYRAKYPTATRLHTDSKISVCVFKS